MATTRQVELIRKLLAKLEMTEAEALDLVDSAEESLLVLPSEDANILIDELISRSRQADD